MKVWVIEIKKKDKWVGFLCKTTRGMARLSLDLIKKVNKQDKFRLRSYSRDCYFGDMPKVQSGIGWLPVKMIKPPCKKDPNAEGTPILIWPRNTKSHTDIDGFAYYGRRATGRSAFYLYGVEIIGVTHWMPMPKGPTNV